MRIKKDTKIKSFRIEVNFFWEWYLLVAMINKAIFKNKCGRNIFYVFPKVSKWLESMKRNLCSSPILKLFKESTKIDPIWQSQMNWKFQNY
jgi:hypothetical protein